MRLAHVAQNHYQHGYLFHTVVLGSAMPASSPPSLRLLQHLGMVGVLYGDLLLSRSAILLIHDSC